MKTTLIAIFTFAIISCNKSNSTKMSDEVKPLKAVPTFSVKGMVITLDASKSTGPITSYGYQLQIASPTQSPVLYLPTSSQKADKDDAGNYKPMVFSNITATVQKTGTYTFDLRVYDKDGNVDLNTFNLDVK